MVMLDVARGRIARMTKRILFRLNERSDFPINRPVYLKDAIEIEGRTGISLLEFAIEGMEAYHASLGRYQYPDEYSLLTGNITEPSVRRSVNTLALPQVDLSITQELLEFYQQGVLPKLCRDDDDPNAYGATVYLDAQLLELLNQRINVGRYIAQAKADANPEILRVVSDSQELSSRLRDKPQEERVIQGVLEAAEACGLETELAERVFRWIIETTIKVEVGYLQALNPAIDAD
jgi:chorismate mutase